MRWHKLHGQGLLERRGSWQSVRSDLLMLLRLLLVVVRSRSIALLMRDDFVPIAEVKEDFLATDKRVTCLVEGDEVGS